MTSGLYEPDLVNTSVGKWTTGFLESKISFLNFGHFLTKGSGFLFCLFGTSLDQRNPFKGGSCIFTSLKEKELHLISNGKMSIHQMAEIAKDIHPFVTALHLREKQKSAKELFQAVELLTNVNVPPSKIVINDRVDVAIVAKVLGVQLAYHSLDTSCVKEHFPQLRVGTSIHSYEEGQNAKEKGADYLLYGHVFPSQSKPGKTPKGLEELTRLSQLNIPVIAIGGITPENTEEVLQAGATGIAVMSGVLDARDPLLAVKSYIHAFRDGGGKYESYI